MLKAQAARKRSCILQKKIAPWWPLGNTLQANSE
jgi:hypothetical protein